MLLTDIRKGVLVQCEIIGDGVKWVIRWNYHTDYKDHLTHMSQSMVATGKIEDVTSDCLLTLFDTPDGPLWWRWPLGAEYKEGQFNREGYVDLQTEEICNRFLLIGD
jgi:hypothetical protein